MTTHVQNSTGRRRRRFALIALALVSAGIAAFSAYAYFLSTGATATAPAQVTSSAPAAGQLNTNAPVYGGGSTTNLVLGGTETIDSWVFNNTGASITVSKVGLNPSAGTSSHNTPGITGIPASCPADTSTWFSGPDVSFAAPTTVAASGNSGHAAFVLTLNNVAADQSCLLGAALTVNLVSK